MGGIGFERGSEGVDGQTGGWEGYLRRRKKARVKDDIDGTSMRS